MSMFGETCYNHTAGNSKKFSLLLVYFFFLQLASHIGKMVLYGYKEYFRHYLI